MSSYQRQIFVINMAALFLITMYVITPLVGWVKLTMIGTHLLGWLYLRLWVANNQANEIVSTFQRTLDDLTEALDPNNQGDDHEGPDHQVP